MCSYLLNFSKSCHVTTTNIIVPVLTWCLIWRARVIRLMKIQTPCLKHRPVSLFTMCTKKIFAVREEGGECECGQILQNLMVVGFLILRWGGGEKWCPAIEGRWRLDPERWVIMERLGCSPIPSTTSAPLPTHYPWPLLHQTSDLSTG